MKISGHICSFPKSGRTWLRYGLLHYFNDLLKSGFEIGFNILRVAFNDTGRGPRPERFDVLPNIVFSHELRDADIDIGRSTMLVRNTLDVLVSYHHHLDASLHFNAPVFENIRDHLISDYVLYMNSWSEHVAGMLVVNYSELSSVACWRQILERLGSVVDDQALQAAFDKCSFEKMQRDEQLEPLNDSADINHRRVRKGKQRGWISEMSEQQADSIISSVRLRLNAKAIDFTGKHKLLEK